LCAQLVARQAHQLDAPHDRPAAGLGDETAQLGAAVELVAAEGEHQRQPPVAQPRE
jgi:hypothetical protein